MIEPDIVHYVWVDLRADVERKGRLEVVEGAAMAAAMGSDP